MLRGDPERLWPARLRWRLRGATLWPAFGAGILIDGVLLRYLPIAGDGKDAKLFGALLLATFFNLVTVAVLAPLAAGPPRRGPIYARTRRRSSARISARSARGARAPASSAPAFQAPTPTAGCAC